VTSSPGLPTFIWALILGLITVAVRWSVLQPGLGIGVLARNAPDSWVNRMISLRMYSVFGGECF